MDPLRIPISQFDLTQMPVTIHYTVGAVEHHTVERTWKERLLSRPWRPLQKTKIIETPSMYQYTKRNSITIFAHPAFRSEIEQEFADLVNRTGP